MGDLHFEESFGAAPVPTGARLALDAGHLVREETMARLHARAIPGDAWTAERGTTAASKLRAVIASAPVALFAIDPQGVITLSDGRGLAAMGVRPGELVGRSAFEIYGSTELRLTDGSRLSWTDALRRALAGHSVEGECALGARFFDLRMAPQRDEATGLLVGVVGSATDVTERNETRERLLVADRLAAIGTLAAGAAHEINNPLTYATIHVDHVARQLRRAAAAGAAIAIDDHADATPALLDALARVAHGLQRVRDITRSLLTFSHGNLEARNLLDVNGVLESSIQMALHEIQHRARLVRELGKVPPVEGNETRLGQVFLNLLVNAAQAIPEGSQASHEVLVATRTDDDGRAVVEISDTGVGIPPDVLPRVFDPFFTSKATGEGTGLGLSVSLGTVRALGGTIDVRSRPGERTTFRVALPPATGWRRSQHPPSSVRIAAAVRARLLVVDDDALVGEAIARAMQPEADVDVLREGREAAERLARGERWDLILCDLMMPEMSGMDLYREALARAPDAARSIVFMTAGAFTRRARAFVESAGKRCLDKPIDAEVLRELVRASCRPRSDR